MVLLLLVGGRVLAGAGLGLLVGGVHFGDGQNVVVLAREIDCSGVFRKGLATSGTKKR